MYDNCQECGSERECQCGASNRHDELIYLLRKILAALEGLAKDVELNL